MNNPNLNTFLLCFVGSMLVGCGGGSGGGGGSTSSSTPQAPFAVSSTSPAAGALTVARDGSFSAIFNAPLGTASVNSTSVQLTGPEGNTIPASATASGSSLTLNPVAGGLPGGTQYIASIASTIADNTGRQLGSATSVSFTTAAQSWAPLANVGSLRGFTGDTQPNIVADAAGNVTVLWLGDAIYSSRLAAGSTTWSAPAALPAGFGGRALAAGANGDAYAMFVNTTTSNTGTTVSIMVSRFNASTNTWGTPVPANIAPTGVTPANVTLVSGAGGSVTAVSYGTGSTGVNGGFFASSLDPATQTWSTPTQIAPFAPTTNYMMGLLATADGKGNIVVTWSQDYSEYAAYYNASTGIWTESPVLEDEAFDYNMPTPGSIAIDGNGVATVAWNYTNTHFTTAVTPMYAIKFARFNPANSTWSAVANVDMTQGQGSVTAPLVVADMAGNTTAMWLRNEGIYYSRITSAAASWSSPQPIPGVPPVTPISETTYSSVVDIAGNVTFVYTSMPSIDMVMNMNAIQYSATTDQWGTSTVMGTPTAGTTVFNNQPVLAVDGTGTVTASWYCGLQTGATWAGQGALVATQFR